MRKGFKRYGIVVLGLLVCLLIAKPVQAQHIDVFKLGPGSAGKPPERGEYAAASEIDNIKVEDHYSYEVPVEKDKIDKDNILRTDIELVELAEKDKASYQWHQVEILEEREVTQVHTRRIVGKLKCTRKRTGVIYWMPDGVKYVDWGIWSMWDCTKGE